MLLKSNGWISDVTWAAFCACCLNFVQKLFYEPFAGRGYFSAKRWQFRPYAGGLMQVMSTKAKIITVQNCETSCVCSTQTFGVQYVLTRAQIPDAPALASLCAIALQCCWSHLVFPPKNGTLPRWFLNSSQRHANIKVVFGNCDCVYWAYHDLTNAGTCMIILVYVYLSPCNWCPSWRCVRA